MIKSRSGAIQIQRMQIGTAVTKRNEETVSSIHIIGYFLIAPHCWPAHEYRDILCVVSLSRKFSENMNNSPQLLLLVERFS